MKIIQSSNKYYLKNKDKILERNKIWKEKNREKYLDARERYYQKNKKKIISKTTQWQKENPEKKKESAKKTYQKHKEKMLMGCRDRRITLKLELLNHYSQNKLECNVCGFNDIDCLALDHINGGGSLDRKKEPSSYFYRRLKREGFPEGFQVLCNNCNWKKHINKLRNKKNDSKS